jgi:serine phosphatase RsbU (regulator of sigma subunit)/anti-sigma regulatory factor (Ser/Thr protein kinase)
VKRGLALLRLGYVVVIGIMLIAVLPFVIENREVTNDLGDAIGDDGHARSLLRTLDRNGVLVLFGIAAATVVAVLCSSLVRRSVRATLEREEGLLRDRIALADVHGLASALSQARTVEEVGRLAVREACRALGASTVHLWVENDHDRLLLAGTTDSLAANGAAPSILSKTDVNAPAVAIRTGEILRFENRAAFAERFPGWVSVFDVHDAAALAVVPTRGPHTVYGALEVYFDRPARFDDVQQTLLALTADQIGTALERARTRDRENEAAARLQESLLGPRLLVDGAGHSSRYLAAEATLTIGGDWHNAQRLPDARILIAVGDVVGRGLEAATVMGQLRSAVSASALRCPTPGDLLLCLDDFAAQIPGAASTTVTVAFVDIDNQLLHYVCAGHPPPLLVSADGTTRILDDAVSWPLAIGAKRSPTVGATLPFPPGSLIVMYSDGLVERRGESLDVGIDRLTRSVGEHWNLPLDAMCDAVLDDALRGRRRADDVAMLALRSPAAAPDVFLMKVSATTDAVGRVRERLRGWLDDRGLSPNDLTAILVAVGEACTNAIEHAYSDDGKHLFRVEACQRDGEITCCITDSGGWKDNELRSARGNGLAIMQELVHGVEIDRRATGTSVTLTYQPTRSTADR